MSPLIATLHADALRTINKSAFQRGVENEGRDTEGGDVVGGRMAALSVFRNLALLAGCRTNLVYCHQQCFIWFLTNPFHFRVASKPQTRHVISLSSHLL